MAARKPKAHAGGNGIVHGRVVARVRKTRHMTILPEPRQSVEAGLAVLKDSVSLGSLAEQPRLRELSKEDLFRKALAREATRA